MRGARKPGGVEEYFGPYGEIKTQETATCFHCQKIISIPYKAGAKDLPEVCYNCQHFICNDCVGKGCRPFEQELERQEARGRMLRDMGLL